MALEINVIFYYYFYVSAFTFEEFVVYYECKEKYY